MWEVGRRGEGGEVDGGRDERGECREAKGWLRGKGGGEGEGDEVEMAVEAFGEKADKVGGVDGGNEGDGGCGERGGEEGSGEGDGKEWEVRESAAEGRRGR